MHTAPHWAKTLQQYPEPTVPAPERTYAPETADITFIANANNDPQSLTEAKTRTDWLQWKAAIYREI